jgi:thiamine-phosphate pyrophosphorylase
LIFDPGLRLPFPRHGLYAVTGEGHADVEALARAVRAAIAGGAAAIQYRCKSSEDRLAAARRFLTECHLAQVPLIINDDVDLALEIGADGVHLGKDDIPLEEARERLGPSAIVGMSCYDSVERAEEAQRQGASYVAFGRFFPSRSKPAAPCAHLETLTEARSRLAIPIVAIGGITADNGGQLIRAGADLLAVIDAVFGNQDPAVAAKRFQPLFA